MKRLILLTVALISMLLATQAATISFSTPNKPATWAKMVVTANGQPIESGANVEVGTTVVFTADEGIGFHIEWIVNGVKDESTTEGTFSKVISEDTNVEAHYVEHFKFVFKGTPFVKYADAQGVIYTGCNAYFHRGDKPRAFGYSVSMFVRSLGDTIRPDIMLLDEVTSALDNVTQQRVADYLASMKCTRITIAHRLETIRQCDRIIVLGNGRVVKEGTYDELIAAGVLQKG